MKKNNIKKSIIFTIGILFIVCIVLLVIIKIAKNNDQSYKNETQTFEKFAEEYEEQTILPRNIIELYKYKGNNERDTLYKSMKQFVDYISYLRLNIAENDTKQYEEFYKINSYDIKRYLGILEEQEFIEFMKYIENKNLNIHDFQYAEVEKGSSYSEDDYFCFNIKLYYGKTLEYTEFKVGLAQKSSSIIIVKYEMPE